MILSVFITVISGHDKPQPPGCLLGTEIPKITWEKIERSLTDVEDEKTLLVPFKAEGPEGKRMYYGMYHCEEGYVEYAND